MMVMVLLLRMRHSRSSAPLPTPVPVAAPWCVLLRGDAGPVAPVAVVAVEERGGDRCVDGARHSVRRTAVSVAAAAVDAAACVAPSGLAADRSRRAAVVTWEPQCRRRRRLLGRRRRPGQLQVCLRGIAQVRAWTGAGSTTATATAHASAPARPRCPPFRHVRHRALRATHVDASRSDALCRWPSCRASCTAQSRGPSVAACTPRMAPARYAGASGGSALRMRAVC